MGVLPNPGWLAPVDESSEAARDMGTLHASFGKSAASGAALNVISGRYG